MFPENPAAPESTTNLLHNLTSTIAFVAGIVGVALLTRRLGTDDRWPSYRSELVVTVAVVLVTFVGFMGSVFTDSAYVGLTQRLFIGVLSLWVMGQSYRLYRQVGSSETL